MASGGYHPARAWYWRALQRIGLVVHIWGSGREANTLYLRRWNLTPRRGYLPLPNRPGYRWWDPRAWRIEKAQLLFHTFYRGDDDPDPHDHPWDFWTFPLSRVGYWEEAMEEDGQLKLRYVRGRMWSYRPRNHCHRVLGPRACFNRQLRWHGSGFPMRTLVLRREPDREDGAWGFWVSPESPHLGLCGPFVDGGPPRQNPRVGVGTPSERVKVPWRTYILGEKQTKGL